MIIRVFRKIISTISLIIALPASLPFIILGYIVSPFDRFSEVSVAVSKIPFYFGEHVRYFYYKALLKSLGKKVTFKYGSFCQYRETEIGANNLFGYYNIVGQATIGNDVLCGNNVVFTSGLNQHKFDNSELKIREQKGFRQNIKIGSDIWIGNNSTICANIGDRVVIGVSSNVVKDLASKGVYVGNPAKLIKEI